MLPTKAYRQALNAKNFNSLWSVHTAMSDDGKKEGRYQPNPYHYQPAGISQIERPKLETRRKSSNYAMAASEEAEQPMEGGKPKLDRRQSWNREDLKHDMTLKMTSSSSNTTAAAAAPPGYTSKS